MSWFSRSKTPPERITCEQCGATYHNDMLGHSYLACQTNILAQIRDELEKMNERHNQ